MLHRPRLIPCMLLNHGDLVKTVRFREPNYLGDPINAMKIFNEKCVDELCVQDISASKEGRGPDFDLLRDMAEEAFMPLSYGGGITTVEEAARLFHIGFEKVILNTAFFENPELITRFPVPRRVLHHHRKCQYKTFLFSFHTTCSIQLLQLYFKTKVPFGFAWSTLRETKGFTYESYYFSLFAKTI